jgi:hypothetical protein
MFKKLGSALDRRQQKIERFQSNHQKTTDAVALFLQEKFSDVHGVLSYRWERDILWIQTANKVVATELTMHLPEFSQFLRVRSIEVSRIIVQ